MSATDPAPPKAALCVTQEATSGRVDMVLYCPRCRGQHVDRADPQAGWTNPPHRSHLCRYCGCVWRPADVPTNGVVAIATAGREDWPIQRHCRVCGCDDLHACGADEPCSWISVDLCSSCNGAAT